MPWRTAQSQFKMTPQPNITQTLADRRPHAHAEAAATRLGLRSRRQADPGRHPAAASLNIACWNVRSLSVHNDCDSHSPRKSALIDLELARLSIDICALSETWLTETGSIREGYYTFFWSGYPDGSRPRHGSGFAVRNSLLPCLENPVAVSPRLMTCDLSFPPATSLFCQHMRRPLRPPLRRKIHSTISCPGQSG